ncbi:MULTISPECIES: TetR/AcrR family transcriptional regulator [unclassified Pseudonocardia]|uniref:TetR/AcrR family transcriptional regulator n=1 Tax=unclassified Pseudonocardia TaxID=2619320 RepID=UPI000A73793E|nr:MULTISPECIES: TetR/AcrR family transcriptional regulator [unclassified Pseudonocardia]
MSAAPDRPSKGDRTRRRLLDAAAAHLATNGPAGVSLSGIAKAAGLQTGSVYFHFGSKDELIATVLEEGLRESLRHLEDALAPLADADPGPRLWAAVRAHLDALVELSDYAAVVLAMPEHDLGGSVAVYRSLKQQYGARWTELVENAQRAGAIAAGPDPRLVRDLLFGAMNEGAGGRGRPDRPPDDCTAAVRELLSGPTPSAAHVPG